MGGRGATRRVFFNDELLRDLYWEKLQKRDPVPPPPLVRQAVNRYQWLAALLKGEQPGGLLPPAPRGYVASRLQQLAGALQALLAALPTMRQGHELLQSPSNPAYSLFANLAR